MAKNIYWRGSAWRLRTTDPSGKRKSKTVYYPNSPAGLKKAEKDYKQWIKALDYGEVSFDAPYFGNLSQEYLANADLKLSTAQSYKQLLNKWWMEPFAAIPVDRIKPRMIREALRNHDTSQKTKRNALIPIRRVFDLAVEEEFITANPVDAIRLRKHQKPPIDAFTPEEKEKILGRLEGDAKLFYRVAFETGMRTGEMLALKWEDLSGQQLSVTKAMVRREITTVKTERCRGVYVTKALLSALRASPGYFKGGYIFRNTLGGPHLDADNFNEAWKIALESARIRYRRSYTCRHTRASAMLMQGNDPAFAAKQLGHSLEMFLKTYAMWISDVKDKEQFERLEAIR